MTSISKLRMSSILPSVKCSNCDKYVELSKMGEHTCEKAKVIKGAYPDDIEDYAYSSSFPGDLNSPLKSETMINEMLMFPSIHNKSMSSDEFRCRNSTSKSKECSQKKRQIFDRLNAVMPGPLGLRNHSTNTKHVEHNHSQENVFPKQTDSSNKNVNNPQSLSSQWMNGTSNQPLVGKLSVSPPIKHSVKEVPQEAYPENGNTGLDKAFLSLTCENVEKISLLKDKSNLREYTNEKACRLPEKSKKIKNDGSIHYSSQTLKKESRFPDENSERHLLEWARRDKELCSRFIEKAPNPVMSIQEHIQKNTHSKMLNDKKSSNSSRYGYFLERDSNSTTLSTSSNISRDEKTSTCSMSSPNSDLSISNAFLKEHKNASRSDLSLDSFEKTFNGMENSFCTFYTCPDTFASQTKNRTQKNPVNNKHNSNLYCRKCNKYIEGKSVRCSDGKISGRFHRECFKCFKPDCENLFTTSDVYVFEGEPFCAKHYHILNNSLCVSCGEGIEGKCFQTETDEKYHFYCFVCSSCKKRLNEEYFDIDGKVYCEIDAMKLAFIESQLRLLAQPFSLPLNWRENAKLDEYGNELSETIVTHALYRLNVLSRKHQRVMFSSQAIRHVAEQIDKLYKSEQMPFHKMQLSLIDVKQLPNAWPSADEESHER
ncbi:hypothetical protein PORY_002692 [Pneumocystis oryctolagi]|uniref:Uncharacterized protein n=1 Tax=Pneumocystis oryctolagi TaxID=42067 RepID=A0ACB7CAE8_9ASCO|nr:hypothetical protein PORY_002692 [Pneumocystis oryctolagi]